MLDARTTSVPSQGYFIEVGFEVINVLQLPSKEDRLRCLDGHLLLGFVLGFDFEFGAGPIDVGDLASG